MVYFRISPTLATQSQYQSGFTPGVRIQDALMVVEWVISCSLEFKVPVWLMSFDLHRALDRVDHRALFDELSKYDLPHCFIALIEGLYALQYGSANGSAKFPIDRGNKQGNVFSLLFFNCFLSIMPWINGESVFPIVVYCCSINQSDSRICVMLVALWYTRSH